MAPFISAAPRPCRRPFATSPEKGSLAQFSRGPGGTTSVWPAKQKCLPSLLPTLANRFSIGVPPSSKRRRWQAKPIGFRAASSTPMAPASAGVTLGLRMRSAARATGSIMLAPGSVAKQFVDRGLGPGLLIDPLHDDGAIEARPRRAVGQRLARQRARYHDRIGRHAAIEDLAGRTVDDLGGGADEDAHREDG